jgi:predicted dehydrogenase
VKRPPKKIKAALLGIDHPHSALLLRTLQNLPEICGILIWQENVRPSSLRKADAGGKIETITRDLSVILQREDVDFVIVCVRHDLAADVATQAIAAGKPVLMEKPAGLNSAEISRLSLLARRKKIMVGVLYGQRAHPAVQAARREVAAGRLGRLLTVEARMVTTQVRFREPRSWLFQRAAAGGGILTWLGCHYLDLIAYITRDAIVSVSAEFATLSGERIDVEDVAVLTLRFRSGAVGTLHTGYLLAGRGGGYRNPAGFENYLACSGRKGRLVWRGMKSRTLQVETGPDGPAPGLRRMRFQVPPSDSYGGAIGERFMRQFIAALHGKAKLPATLDDALRVIRLVEAAQRSARTRRHQPVA